LPRAQRWNIPSSQREWTLLLILSALILLTLPMLNRAEWVSQLPLLLLLLIAVLRRSQLTSAAKTIILGVSCTVFAIASVDSTKPNFQFLVGLGMESSTFEYPTHAEEGCGGIDYSEYQRVPYKGGIVSAQMSFESLQGIRKYFELKWDGYRGSYQLENLRLHLETVNLHELLHNLVEQYKPAASNKNIMLSFSSSVSFIEVSLDPEKIKRAIGNLITNGLKFTHPGGFVQVEMMVQDDLVQLRVVDNGIGIPPEMLEKLFLKYTKAGRKGTRGERTTGLGMYITKNILESHRASIQVRSKVNKGTEFEIQIPRNASLA